MAGAVVPGWLLDLLQLVDLPITIVAILAALGWFWNAARESALQAIEASSATATSPAYDRRFERVRSAKLAHGYRYFLQGALNWIAALSNEDRRSEAEKAIGETWRAPLAWTGQSYFLLLGLAVFYPVGFVLGGWILGGGGVLGDFTLLSPRAPLVSRALILVSLAIAVVGGIHARMLARRRRTFVAFVLVIFYGFLSFCITELSLHNVGTVAGVFAVAVAAVASAVAFAGAGVAAVAVGVAVVGAVGAAAAVSNVVVNVFFLGAIAVVGAILITLWRRNQSPLIGWLFGIGLFVLLFSLFTVDGSTPYISISISETTPVPQPEWWPDWLGWRDRPVSAETNSSTVASILFLSVLPAANALFDWVSFSVSRWLLNRIADGRHKFWRSFGYAAADVGLATLFLFLVAMSAIGSLAFAAKLQSLGGAPPVFDAPAILAGIEADPTSTTYWWIYFMLLTTLIPTFVHLIAASASAVFWAFSVLPRNWLIQQFERGRGVGLGARDTDAAGQAAVAYASLETLSWAIGIIAIGIPAFSIYRWALPLGGGVLSAAKSLVAAINAWNGWPFF